jgi:hypothetical protein
MDYVIEKAEWVEFVQNHPKILNEIIIEMINLKDASLYAFDKDNFD